MENVQSKNDMTERFIESVNRESELVDLIISSMFHSKKEDGRRFLMLMNDIVDYYIKRSQTNEDLCFPIVFIPNAPEWAREVLIKFLIIKMSLFYNNDKRSELRRRLKKAIYFSGPDAQKRTFYEQKFRRYVRPLLGDSISPSSDYDGHKNLIFCRDNDITVSLKDKNSYIQEFYGEIDKIESSDNLTVCEGLTAKDIRKKIRSTNGGIPTIDNMFVFYTGNEQCKSLINESLVKIPRVRNCFVFYFSDKPQRAYNVIEKKHFLCHREFPRVSEKELKAYEHFITFTQDESEYMFGVSNETERCYVEGDSIMYESIGEVFEDSPHPMMNRIKLSLCFDELSRDAFASLIRNEFPSYPEDLYMMSLNFQLQKAQNEVIPIIREHIKPYAKIAVILPYDETGIDRDMFNRIFGTNKVFSFYKLSDLKSIKNKNKITEKFIINFVYRSHNAGAMWHRYPNSFDPYILGKGQNILEIVQGFPFSGMYEWDRYDYDKVWNGLLNCEFRRKKIGLYPIPDRPDVQRARTVMDDVVDERTASRMVKTYKINFVDGQRITIPENEPIIINVDGENVVARLKEYADDNDLSSIKEIQRLDKAGDVFMSFVSRQSKYASEREYFFRDTFYKHKRITKEERDSGIYLWKIILKHKVDSLGPKKVFKEIMSGLKESDRIQFNTFQHWSDYSLQMMLPLQKVCQRALMKYLDIQDPYLSIMRQRKMATISGTKRMNSIVDGFMSDFLFQEIDYQKWVDFESSDINELLGLTSISELKTLISLIKETIDLKQVSFIA
jgi:hypothetical protein